MNPKISVIIPAYNVEDYIEECLKSVIRQSLNELEIICVNDGSTDGTLQIIQEYASNDPRIVVIDKDNGGYGSAMNRGLDIAVGEYIGILESDDCISHNMYEELYRIALSASPISADLVKSAWYQHKQDGTVETINPYKGVPQEAPVEVREYSGLLIHHPSTWSGIYKRSFLMKNKIRYVESPGAGWVDNLFFIQTLYCSKVSAFTSKPFYHYRTDRPGNSSFLTNCSVPFTRLQEMFDYIEEHEGHGEFFTSLCQRAYTYLRITLDSPYYTSQQDEVRPLLTDVISRIPESIMVKECFSKRDRENYERFRILKDDPELAYNPLVSIIVPCHNCATNISECISSIRDQTFNDLEILCVDGFSSDQTRYRLQEIAEDDGRFKVICKPSRVNTIELIQDGLEAARGLYCWIIEPSGKLYPLAIEYLYTHCKESNLNACLFGYYEFFNYSGGWIQARANRIHVPGDAYYRFMPISSVSGITDSREFSFWSIFASTELFRANILTLSNDCLIHFKSDSMSQRYQIQFLPYNLYWHSIAASSQFTDNNKEHEYEALEQQLHRIKASYSYRIGRAMTAIPRFLVKRAKKLKKTRRG